jgi:FkbM family methyltransferase
VTRLLVDCGAGVGAALEILYRPGDAVVAFEPQAELAGRLRARWPPVLIQEAAAWDRDGQILLYRGRNAESATCVAGKVCSKNPIDYAHGRSVPAIDFAAWLRRTVRAGDEVTVKMDIEGAEFVVLPHLLRTGALSLIRTLWIEWHDDRFPVAAAEAQQLRGAVAAACEVQTWR